MLTQGQSVFLDFLRYFLSAIVVVGHGFGFFFNYYDGFFPESFPYPQSIAVVCFFYLSGFLVVGSQLNRKTINERGLKGYLFDRFARVYITLIPSLFFVVIVDFVFQRMLYVNLAEGSVYYGVGRFFDNFVLIPSMPYGTMRPIWSLMYEWWIYLLFGGLFFFKSNRLLSLFLVLLGTYYTFFINAKGEAGNIWFIWVLGGVSAYVQNRISFDKINANFFSLGSLFFCFFSMFLYWESKNAYDLIAGSLLALAIFSFLNSDSSFFSALEKYKMLAKKLAGFSFTLFLTHYTVLVYTAEYFDLYGWKGSVIGFLMANFLSFYIAIFTENKLPEVKKFLNGLSIRLWKTKIK